MHACISGAPTCDWDSQRCLGDTNTDVLYLSVCLVTLLVHEQYSHDTYQPTTYSKEFADLPDSVMTFRNMMANLSMNVSSAPQQDAACDQVHNETSDRGQYFSTNFTTDFIDVVFNGLVVSAVTPPAGTNVTTNVITTSGLSEYDIDTLVEEGVG